MSDHTTRWVVKWSGAVGLAAAAVVAGIVLLACARYGSLATRPWEYLGMAVAIVGAVAGMILAIAHADEIDKTPADEQADGPTEGPAGRHGR